MSNEQWAALGIAWWRMGVSILLAVITFAVLGIYQNTKRLR